MSNSDLNGVIAATVTPVDEAFEVDAKRLAQHCERLLGTGCSFVSTFGTTGEGASLSTRQKIKALQVLKAEGADLARHIPSIMTSSADEAAGIVAEAAQLDCRAVLVLPPFYYDTLTDEGVVGFFEDILEKAGRPDIDVLLYNIPRFSGIWYTPELIEKLIMKFGSAIAGLKDSTGRAGNAEMLARRFPQMSIFTGDDRVMPGLVQIGGAGMIGGIPNLFCQDARKIYEAPSVADTGDLQAQQARRIEIVDGNGSMLAVRAGLAALYRDAEWQRAVPPLKALDDKQAAHVMAALAETGFAPEKAA